MKCWSNWRKRCSRRSRTGKRATRIEKRSGHPLCPSSRSPARKNLAQFREKETNPNARLVRPFLVMVLVVVAEPPPIDDPLSTQRIDQRFTDARDPPVAGQLVPKVPSGRINPCSSLIDPEAFRL